MNERQLQFRVGILVISASIIGAALIVQFGNLRFLWEERYAVAAHFESAPGVHASSPVKMSGISIGTVRSVFFDQEQGGVTVLIDVQSQYRLRQGTRPRIVQSLLGDSAVEFLPGDGPDFLPPGSQLEGEMPLDPMEIVRRLEGRTDETFRAFTATSEEWRTVAVNLNNLMQTKQGDLNVVVERAAESLQAFTVTMQNANRMISETTDLIADPEMQKSIRQTMTSLPVLVEETRQTIVVTRQAIESVNGNLKNLEEVTAPLARRGDAMVVRLDNSLKNLDAMLAELSRFSRLMAHQDGTLQKLLADPELYQNLNRSAASLAVVLRNMEPVMNDLRIFSDRIARHPEILGVGGVVTGSSGLKDPAGVAPVQTAPPSADRFRTPFE